MKISVRQESKRETHAKFLFNPFHDDGAEMERKKFCRELMGNNVLLLEQDCRCSFIISCSFT